MNYVLGFAFGIGAVAGLRALTAPAAVAWAAHVGWWRRSTVLGLYLPEKRHGKIPEKMERYIFAGQVERDDHFG